MVGCGVRAKFQQRTGVPGRLWRVRLARFFLGRVNVEKKTNRVLRVLVRAIKSRLCGSMEGTVFTDLDGAVSSALAMESGAASNPRQVVATEPLSSAATSRLTHVLQVMSQRSDKTVLGGYLTLIWS